VALKTHNVAGCFAQNEARVQIYNCAATVVNIDTHLLLGSSDTVHCGMAEVMCSTKISNT